MSNITPLPWYATEIHVQSASINEDNYVCEAEGVTREQALANAAMIVKAVNNYGELVELLRTALAIVIEAAPYLPNDTDDLAAEWHPKAQAMIAKVEGRAK